MLRKMRTLSDRRGAGRSDLDAQTTDRLVSAVVEGDTAPTAESAGGNGRCGGARDAPPDRVDTADWRLRYTAPGVQRGRDHGRLEARGARRSATA